MPAMNASPNDDDRLRDAWLVAAWPGLGGTALIGASHLVQALGARQTDTLAGEGYFELQHVDVEGGVLRTPRLPRGTFFEWTNPNDGPDLMIFIGEAQPQTGGDGLAREVLGRARARGVRRVATFASLARPIHPSDDIGVHAVATDREMLAKATSAGATPLAEGQIGGLNGVLVGVGDVEGVPGVCLMADIPYFAGGAPNPKSAAAAIRVFTRLSGVEVDLSDLEEQARVIERQLTALLERLQDAAREGELPEQVEADLTSLEPSEPAGDEAEEPESTEVAKPELSYGDRERLEELFERARKDRTQAFELKSELDRLGAFEQYEDRFLDLFKRGE